MELIWGQRRWDLINDSLLRSESALTRRRATTSNNNDNDIIITVIFNEGLLSIWSSNGFTLFSAIN